MQQTLLSPFADSVRSCSSKAIWQDGDGVSIPEWLRRLRLIADSPYSSFEMAKLISPHVTKKVDV